MTFLDLRGLRGSALAAGLFVVAHASGATAADLGQECCADLEERIAELEATTARKGNRKVSLTISGYIAQQITFWDDGGESNTYLFGMGPTQASHFKIGGEAQITPALKAGYLMRIQMLFDNPFGASQSVSNTDLGVNTQMSYWYLQHKGLGKVSVGKMAHAGKSAAMFTDQSGTQIISNYVLFDGAGFDIRRGDGTLSGVTWGNIGYCYAQSRPWGGDCNGIVNNGVRYDSPAFGGFTVSASWAEDDFWEIAGRYAGEVAGFKLLGGVAYTENKDELNQMPTPLGVLAAKDTSYFQVGAYAQHIATGLFLHGAYGLEDNSETLLDSGDQPLDGEHWYVKGGIRQKWTPLGHTVVWGEYGAYHDQLGPAALDAGATGSELQKFGGGIAQEIDSAAMTVWLKYRVQQGDIDAPLDADLDNLDDLHLVTVGGMINF